MDDDLYITVPGAMQLVYMPRQMALQRISTMLRIPIKDVDTRREGSVANKHTSSSRCRQTCPTWRTQIASSAAT